MQIFTFYLKKLMGIKRNDKKVDEFITKCLSDSYEPSSNSIKNIISFSDAYRYEKSKTIGEIEYLTN